MRPVTILAIGLVASGTTALLVYRAVENRVIVKTVSAGSAEVQMRPVVVTSGEVPFGATLTLEQLKLVNWPAHALPPSAFETRESLVGRVAITRFGTNEPVTSDKLAPTGNHGLLPLAIEHGMRAVTVRVNEVAAVGGFIAPGSHVDVLVTAEVKPLAGGEAPPAAAPEATTEPGRHTRTVLQDVQVVALGQLLESSGQPKPGEQLTTATLLVSPAQGELLALGAAEGTLQLVLRNFEDHQVVRSDGMSANDLFDTEAENVLAGNKVEMIRGSQRFLVSF